MKTDRIKELEEKIADLKARMPAHTPRVHMIQELDALEEQLEQALAEAEEENP